MKRRELIKGAIGLLAFGAAESSLGARPCPQTLTGTEPKRCPVPDGPISQLAANMTSGEWAELTTTTGLSALRSSYTAASPSNGSFLEYNANGYMYNDELHFTGSSDNGSRTWHLKYSDATGAWTKVAETRPGHTYCGFSIDQVNGDFYQYYPGGAHPQLYKGNSGGNWALHSEHPGGFVVPGGNWFPELNGGTGGFVAFDGALNGGELYKTLADGRTWSRIGGSVTPNMPGGAYHNSVIYLPNQRVVVFGGGNGRREFMKLDADETITRLADTKGNWQPWSDFNCGSMVAFKNGRILHLMGAGQSSAGGENTPVELWEYNYAANTWSQSTGPGISNWKWMATTAMDSLGVMHVMTQTLSIATPREYIYKL